MHHVADYRLWTLSRPSWLAQISDKWKPITLTDGAFDLDELKRDISTSDMKFACGEEVQTLGSHPGILNSRATAQGSKRHFPL